jgi:hypothetical protein
LTWADAVLDELAASALLGYLAVAHYGRGRGEWADAEHPAFWQQQVDDIVDARRDALHEIWRQRPRQGGGDELGRVLTDWFIDASAALLEALYPGHGPRAAASGETESQTAGQQSGSL